MSVSPPYVPCPAAFESIGVRAMVSSSRSSHAIAPLDRCTCGMELSRLYVVQERERAHPCSAEVKVVTPVKHSTFWKLPCSAILVY